MNLIEQQEKEFSSRHIGPTAAEEEMMLKLIGVKNLNELIDKTVPANIRNNEALNIPDAMSEAEYLQHIKTIGSKNIVAKNYIGQGYYGTFTPRLNIFSQYLFLLIFFKFPLHIYLLLFTFNILIYQLI